MKKDLTALLVLIAVLILIAYILSPRSPGVPSPAQTPPPTNGNSVSETTPNTPVEPSEITITAKINNPTSGLGVTIAPIEVVEDSRCPSDVVCIQAGTVRVRVKITDPNGERVLIAVLNTPIPSAYAATTLTEVEPEARAEIPIRTNEYRLKFEIKK